MRDQGRTRASVWALVWLGVLGWGAGTAQADVIYLNAAGATNIERINREIAPARVYDAETHQPFIRGRILDFRHGNATVDRRNPAGRALLLVQAWFRPRPGMPVEWARGPLELPMHQVARITHEVDSNLDLQLMMSDRDEHSGPIGTEAWEQRMAQVLDPGGGYRMFPGWRANPETDEQRAQIMDVRASTGRKIGWVLQETVRGPLFTIPPDATPEESIRLQQEFAQRSMARRESLLNERNPFLPDLFLKIPEDTVQSCIRGMALSEHRAFTRSNMPPDTAAPESEQTFREQIQAVLELIFRMAHVDPTEIDDPQARQRAERYRGYGRRARAALLSILEAARPHAVSPQDVGDRRRVEIWLRGLRERMDRTTDESLLNSMQEEYERLRAAYAPESDREREEVRQFVLQLRRAIVEAEDEAERQDLETQYQQLLAATAPRRDLLPEAAAIDIDPTTMAYYALEVIQNLPPWWWYEDYDADRLLTAVARLGSFPGWTETTPRFWDDHYPLKYKARATLIMLLRPSASTENNETDAAVREAREEMFSQLQDSAQRFREDMGPLLISTDPNMRSFVHDMLLHAGYGEPLASRNAIEALFLTATTNLTPQPSEEGADAHVERLRSYLREEERRYAITTLMVLANLGQPTARTADEYSLGRSVMQRINALREGIEEGESTSGESEFVRTLERLAQPGVAGNGLGDRVRRVLNESERMRERIATVRTELNRRTRELRSALQRGAGAAEINRLREAVEAAERELGELTETASEDREDRRR